LCYAVMQHFIHHTNISTIIFGPLPTRSVI
jgi:hypothetical protein